MSAPTQAVPGYYVWCPEGSPVAVHLNVDLVDKLGPEIMKGFAAVPKRGAEVGGVLLGTIEHGDRPIVRIEGFDPVGCTYKFGPSYYLSDEDAQTFDSVFNARRDETATTYAVGYYRSHTREGPIGPGTEDMALMDHFFPHPSQIMLLVRPFATKASSASIFLRENGQFPAEARTEFPFRRQELTGEEPAKRRPLGERRPRSGDAGPGPDAPQRAQPAPRPAPPAMLRRPEPVPAPSHVFRLGLPLLALVAGGVLGFLGAGLVPSSTPPSAENDFSLALAVSRTDDNLTVRWNRDAPAIRMARQGLMEIEDGPALQTVDLDATHLQSGSLIYRNSSPRVRFRLTLTLGPQVMLTESQEWAR